jgi:hypothetical protein
MMQRVLLVASIVVLMVSYRLTAQDACTGLLEPRLVIGQAARVLPGPANNVRAEPSSASMRITQMPGESVFEVLEGPVCDGNGVVWWRIAFNGLEGWTGEGQNRVYWVEPLGVPIVEALYEPIPDRPMLVVTIPRTRTAQPTDLILLDVLPRAATITNLTSGTEPGLMGSWSPDGQRFAFVTLRETTPELYTVRPDGSRQRYLAQLPSTRFTWTSASQQIIVWSESQKPRPLLLIEVLTGHEQVLELGCDDPLLRGLEVDFPYQLTIEQGRIVQHLACAEAQVIASLPDPSAIVQQMVLAPDGASIAWTAQLSFPQHNEQQVETLFVQVAGATDPLQVTFGVEVEGISWSPDSRSIAYSTRANDIANGAALIVYDVIANSQQTLFSEDVFDQGALVRSLAWSPDGEQIAFNSAVGVSDVEGQLIRSMQLYIVRADGSDLQPWLDPLSAGFEDMLLIWRPVPE